MISEYWRPIIGYEDRYEVSNIGRIRSIARWGIATVGKWRGVRFYKSKDRKIIISPTGYPRVTLIRDSEPHTFNVHRLVCAAFNGPMPPGKPIVAHYDGNPLNNRPENLRWATDLENASDRDRHGRTRRGENIRTARLMPFDVAAILASSEPALILANRYSVRPDAIRAIRRGQTWRHLKPQSAATSIVSPLP